MSEGYITVDDIIAYGFQVDIGKNGDLFDLLIPRAGALFDILCGVEQGHFLPLAQNAVATPRVVYGLNGPLLAIPPHVGDVVSIGVPAGYTTPTFVEQGGYLRLTNSLGELQQIGSNFFWSAWWAGIAYTVTAKWGYATTPDSVKQAVTEMALCLWRSKDDAWVKAINLDSNQLIFNDAIPKRVKIIAQSFRNQRSATSAFV